jgi:hypothetical protein
MSYLRIEPTELVYERRDRIAVRVWAGAGDDAAHEFHVWTIRDGEAVHRRCFSCRHEAIDRHPGLAL